MASKSSALGPSRAAGRIGHIRQAGPSLTLLLPAQRANGMSQVIASRLESMVGDKRAHPAPFERIRVEVAAGPSQRNFSTLSASSAHASLRCAIVRYVVRAGGVTTGRVTIDTAPAAKI